MCTSLMETCRCLQVSAGPLDHVLLRLRWFACLGQNPDGLHVRRLGHLWGPPLMTVACPRTQTQLKAKLLMLQWACKNAGRHWGLGV